MHQAHTIQFLGDRWQVARIEASEEDLTWMEAGVPGAVHYDLVKAGLLDNPFMSCEAARAAEWVAEADWLYRVEFDLDKGLWRGSDPPGSREEHSWYQLSFRGVDTFSDVSVNGHYLGSTENAYRTYVFDLDPSFLKNTGNVLTVRMKAHGRMIMSKAPGAARMGRDGPVTGHLGKSLIRRYQRNFFTNSSLLNLGTGVLGIGINKPVELHRFGQAKIAQWHSRMLTLTDAEARLSLGVTIDLCPKSPLLGNHRVRATIKDPVSPEQTVCVAEARVEATTLSLELTIPNPKRWWPAGYGRPDLYDLSIELSDATSLLDTVQSRVGLRTVELVTASASGRPTFQLCVNGEKIHLRGYNLIPLDYIKVHGEWSAHERIMTLVRNANANTIRFWGGGAIEEDQLYQACDERGIMVWQDFFLHSNVYPDYDPEFVENFRQESTGIVTRLRNHPSLVLLLRRKRTARGMGRVGMAGSDGPVLWTESDYRAVAADRFRLCP